MSVESIADQHWLEKVIKIGYHVSVGHVMKWNTTHMRKDTLIKKRSYDEVKVTNVWWFTTVFYLIFRAELTWNNLTARHNVNLLILYRSLDLNLMFWHFPLTGHFCPVKKSRLLSNRSSSWFRHRWNYSRMSHMIDLWFSDRRVRAWILGTFTRYIKRSNFRPENRTS